MTKGTMPAGTRPAGAVQEDSTGDPAAARERRLAARQQLDAELEAAGTPGLRLLDRDEIAEFDSIRHRYGGHDVRAAPSEVPSVLAHLPEFVTLANHRRAALEVRDRLGAEWGAWNAEKDRLEEEHRDASVQAVLRGDPRPPAPVIGQPPTDATIERAIEEQLLTVYAVERRTLTENAAVYVEILQEAHRPVLDELEAARRRVLELEDKCRPISDTIDALSRGHFGPVQASTGRRGPSSDAPRLGDVTPIDHPPTGREDDGGKAQFLAQQRASMKTDPETGINVEEAFLQSKVKSPPGRASRDRAAGSRRPR